MSAAGQGAVRDADASVRGAVLLGWGADDNIVEHSPRGFDVH